LLSRDGGVRDQNIESFASLFELIREGNNGGKFGKVK
jgi:hypothetical protein